MKQRILITGATGHVGRETLAALQGSDFDVLAAVRPGTNPVLPTSVRSVPMDYDDEASIKIAFEGVAHLYLMAPVEVRFTERMQRMIRLAKVAGVRRIVHQSQFNADAKPGMQGTWWHNQMEGVTRESGIPYSILRPNAFMVNVITRYADEIRKSDTLVAPAGDSRVSFIDPADIGACAATLLIESGHEGQTFQVTGPESLSFGDVAAILSAELNRTICYVSPSDEEFRASARQAGMPEIAIQLTLDGYMVEKLGCYAEVTDTVSRLLGRPAGTFAEWAKRNRDAFLKSNS